MEYKAPTRKNA